MRQGQIEGNGMEEGRSFAAYYIIVIVQYPSTKEARVLYMYDADAGNCIFAPSTLARGVSCRRPARREGAPPPARCPERRVRSCQDPKTAHRDLVGLRRTTRHSGPRSRFIHSDRCGSIAAIAVGRRGCAARTARWRAL